MPNVPIVVEKSPLIGISIPKIWKGASKMEEGDFREVPWEEISQSDEVKVSASEKDLGKILEKMGYETDEEGYIVHSETGEKVLANDEREIKLSDLGMVTGSKTFIRKNLASFSDYLATKERARKINYRT